MLFRSKRCIRFVRFVMTDDEYDDLKSRTKSDSELFQIGEDVSKRCMVQLLDYENEGKENKKDKSKAKPFITGVGNTLQTSKKFNA